MSRSSEVSLGCPRDERQLGGAVPGTLEGPKIHRKVSMWERGCWWSGRDMGVRAHRSGFKFGFTH